LTTGIASKARSRSEKDYREYRQNETQENFRRRPSVMAHAEAAAESGILAIAHHMAHALQAIPLLPAMVAAAVAAALAFLWMNKRES
jgi:hypothetical protein